MGKTLKLADARGLPSTASLLLYARPLSVTAEGFVLLACYGSGAVSPPRTKGVWGRRGAGNWSCDKKGYVDDEMEMQTFGCGLGVRTS